MFLWEAKVVHVAFTALSSTMTHRRNFRQNKWLSCKAKKQKQKQANKKHPKLCLGSTKRQKIKTQTNKNLSLIHGETVNKEI